MKHTRKAYTLAEMVIVSVIVGIMASVAIPRLNLAAIYKQTADTTVRKIVTDLRRTRSLAISDAANNNDGYELKLYGSGSYDSYSIKNRDTGDKIVEHDIDSNITVTADGNKFKFSPLGDALEGASTITVSSSGRSFTITVTRATGMIRCVEN